MDIKPQANPFRSQGVCAGENILMNSHPCAGGSFMFNPVLLGLPFQELAFRPRAALPAAARLRGARGPPARMRSCRGGDPERRDLAAKSG